jgi:hypothetical protein
MGTCIIAVSRTPFLRAQDKYRIERTRSHGLFSRSNCLEPTTKERSLAKSSRTERMRSQPRPHNKGEKSCNGVGIRHGRFKKPISLCHTKSASRVATEEKSDKKKPVPTSSTGLNCAEKKACHVTSRVKLPTPNNNNLVLIPSGGMSFTDGDGKRSERRVIKIKSSSVGQNKEELLNIKKTAVQETESTEKGCLKKVQMDEEEEEEEALELKLEATKRKLHQRYQQAQNSKRKIQVLDFKDIPKPENAPKRSRNQYRRL